MRLAWRSGMRHVLGCRKLTTAAAVVVQATRGQAGVGEGLSELVDSYRDLADLVRIGAMVSVGTASPQ